jgi:hypothetical protein
VPCPFWRAGSAMRCSPRLRVSVFEGRQIETRVWLWRWLVRVLATQRGLATSWVSVRFTGGKSEDGVGKTGIPLWSGNPPCGHSECTSRSRCSSRARSSP